MPLAERDVNSQQHHQSSTRAKRLPAAGHENSAPSPKTPTVQVAPARQQRFFAPTKASAAKNTPPSSTDRTRAQPHSSRSTPQSRTPASKLPRRYVATSTLTPPTSRWNPASTGRFKHLEDSVNDAQVSPCVRQPHEAPDDQSLVCCFTSLCFRASLTTLLD